jgi:hypothetical protein
MARKVVPGSVVRAWALTPEGQTALAAASTEATGDLTQIGSRGLFHKQVIATFQKETGQKYGTNLPTVRKVKAAKVGADGKTRTVTVNVVPQEARAWALAQADLDVSAKGRLSSDVLAAFAARPV